MSIVANSHTLTETRGKNNSGGLFLGRDGLELGVEMKFINKEDVERMKKEIASEESISTRNPTFDKNVSMESVIAKNPFVIANKAK